MIIKNSLKSKISVLFFCLIWLTFGLLFAYFTLKSYSHILLLYFVIIVFIYFVIINIRDFIAINHIYNFENNKLYAGKKEINIDEIKTVEINKDNKNDEIQYIINEKKKYIIENHSNSNLQNYIQKIVEYKENQFNLSEGNPLFKKENYIYSLIFISLFLSILLPNLFRNSIKEISYSQYVFLLLIVYVLLKDIIYILNLKNSYFDANEIFINKKHINYNEIIKIEKIKAKNLIIIKTENINIKIPARYIKYDDIIENYIENKINKNT